MTLPHVIRKLVTPSYLLLQSTKRTQMLVVEYHEIVPTALLGIDFRVHQYSHYTMIILLRVGILASKGSEIDVFVLY